MTPLHLEIMIYANARVEPMENYDAPAVQEYAAELWRQDVMHAIEHDGEGRPKLWELTSKGRAWLELILQTPQPVQVWSDPRKPK